MAWLLTILALGGIVYLAKIIVEYLNHRDDTERTIERLTGNLKALEEAQEAEVRMQALIRERIPVLQLAVDGIYQRLHEIQRMHADERDRTKRLEVAVCRMQIKGARRR